VGVVIIRTLLLLIRTSWNTWPYQFSWLSYFFSQIGIHENKEQVVKRLDVNMPKLCLRRIKSWLNYQKEPSVLMLYNTTQIESKTRNLQNRQVFEHYRFWWHVGTWNSIVNLYSLVLGKDGDESLAYNEWVLINLGKADGGEGTGQKLNIQMAPTLKWWVGYIVRSVSFFCFHLSLDL